jgi:hypothetical protein
LVGDGVFVVDHELSVTAFTFVVLLSVVGFAILDCLTTYAAGADEHILGFCRYQDSNSASLSFLGYGHPYI